MTETTDSTETMPATNDGTTEPTVREGTPVDERATTDVDAVPTEQLQSAEEHEGDKPRSGGVMAGVAAIVGTVLGAVSLTGTGPSEMLRERKGIIGQIDASTGGGDQIEAYYTAPWHTAALVNGVFALLAIGTAVAALILAGRHTSATWTKSVAWAGLVLGVLGLLASAGMYFDLFGSVPVLPKQPSTQPGG